VCFSQGIACTAVRAQDSSCSRQTTTLRQCCCGDSGADHTQRCGGAQHPVCQSAAAVAAAPWASREEFARCPAVHIGRRGRGVHQSPWPHFISSTASKLLLFRWSWRETPWRRRDTIVTSPATQSECYCPVCGHCCCCCFEEKQHRPSLRICRHRHPTLLPFIGDSNQAACHPRDTPQQPPPIGNLRRM
jgi:hypothetical protein